MKMFRFLFISVFGLTAFAQQTSKVDFIKCDALVLPNAFEKSILGSISYEFKVKKAIDTIKIDAINMQFSELFINGKLVNFKNSGKTLDLFEGFKKGKNIVSFNYSAKPKQTLYFTGAGENLQIWTQGQGKYTSYWLPSFDDVNEKVIFNLSVEFNNNFQTLANGSLNRISTNTKEGTKQWHYQMQKPMSSYLVMLAIGNFEKQLELSKSGTPLEFYIDKSDVDKFEPTFRYSRQIFDYLEQEIGVKYPWHIYRQVPVRDFLYAGMENTTSTIFAQDFVVDSIGFNDRNYINVNAHELAHQWFGDLVTAESSKHHWLQEGFATYYALLAERHLFGDDYFYDELNTYAEQLKRVAKTDTIPVLNENAGSLTFYKKGAWALHVMREDIGPEKFQKAVKKYLKKYQYKNVNTDDFLKIVKQVSGYDVANFKKVWLEQSGFETALAQKYLDKNKFIAEFQQVRKTKKTMGELIEILNSSAYFPIKEYIIYQTQNLPFDERKALLEVAMNTNSVQVRQAVAETVKVIPADFKMQYETLLNDASYKTKEIALGNLWRNFPEERLNYLELTKAIEGNNDKSFKLTWLALAMNTENILAQTQLECYEKLLDFATMNYESSVRQNALELLLQLNPNDEKVIALLFQTTTHHKWQFTKFGREAIRKLLKNAEYRRIVTQLANKTTGDLKELYLRFLNE
ncbi:M1 family metallopeptidase [Flavobacterium psychraquaticum]|uniref:M1 family metallopeptidase n=1 Tax=Flavobacterium psychraquaticum TaxID=3103958 RepID=UPI002ACD3167|nr:M1 family metallopeptidase [Flavobacterium sp. LB-N7T]